MAKKRTLNRQSEIANPLPQVEIISEQEHGKGWQFAIQVLDDHGTLRRHTLTLSWADYNLWSPDGADEPARVAEAVMMFLLSKSPADKIGERFDASRVRREFVEADSEIPKRIQRSAY